MFSRGRQWVSEAELDADLAGLLGPTGIQAAPGGLRAPLSAAEVVVGRFFFVHEAQATRDDALLRTYEFLHATFGEYLIARLISRELGDLADAAQLAAGRARAQPIDDAFLHALLSFMPVTMRSTIMSFLADLFAAQPVRRQQLGDVVLVLFHDALYPRHDTRYRDYEPLRLPVPARHAAYSSNLAILSVLAIGEVTASQLFPSPRHDPVKDWRYIALLWRSQLPVEGWVGLAKGIAVNRIWDDGQREIILSRSDPMWTEDGPVIKIDPLWTYAYLPGIPNEPREPGHFSIWTPFNDRWLPTQVWFECDDGEDALAHALEPLTAELSAAIVAFHSYWPNPRRAVSAAHALIALWLASGKDSTQDELVSAYDTCLNIVIKSFAPHHVQARTLFRTLVLRQLANDQQRMPDDWLNSAVRRIRDAVGSPVSNEGPELLRIAEEAFPGLMTADHTEQIQAKDSPS
jgi:hypothetical protein